jgi:NTP pyrophosphatase (non-canonical NTP hydrolase)
MKISVLKKNKKMTFEEYQKESRKTAKYPSILGKDFVYPTLGLAGEAGEVAEKVKKIFRDKNAIVDESTKNEIAKELGDVLWYVSQIATELGISMEDVAEGNIKKIMSRMERNLISGDGDNR